MSLASIRGRLAPASLENSVEGKVRVRISMEMRSILMRSAQNATCVLSEDKSSSYSFEKVTFAVRDF